LNKFIIFIAAYKQPQLLSCWACLTPVGTVSSLTKPSEEEERKRVELSFDIIYRYHGKTVLDFCWACKPHFMLNIFSFINFFSAVKPSLGGENSS
jgi:hypothetical protein